jgi:transcriptional regulator with XRE-family HTH domain
MPSQVASQVRASIAFNIDRAIDAKGLTNREVGEAIGSTEHQVWRWRRGRHTPSIESLTALARLLLDGDLAAFYEPAPDKRAA